MVAYNMKQKGRLQPKGRLLKYVLTYTKHFDTRHNMYTEFNQQL